MNAVPKYPLHSTQETTMPGSLRHLFGAMRHNEPPRITKWKDVAVLLEQGWRLDGKFDLVSPTGERRSAWGNAIKACRDRGLLPAAPKEES
jgi:hypothetical protein